ncbi:molybdate ABC transporter substrate-binding protein [Chitinibacter tainanensis]|uniref:molybdate ABC transporter substrate-binding protein n=1 Tax=Chitinibacter tainanensis TaxID=230667 RepID=UPI0023576358|nr:molybdate ABC transporter substrate-binding protein [Chitinibacter tainanensis]
MHRLLTHLTLAALCLLLAPAHAAEVLVAVASNMAEPAKELARQFSAQSGHRITFSSAATGKLYAQISQGAPFAVLLAADTATPTRLGQEGLALADTQFTYATGRLVLWSAAGNTPNEKTLSAGQFAHLAIANPAVAPYGQAAMAVLQRLGIAAQVRPKLVYGENISQTQQFVATGHAEYGLLAASLVWRDGRWLSGQGWWVPSDWHAPLQQDAVLLRAGANQAAAREWLAFLRSPAARATLQRYGYQ